MPIQLSIAGQRREFAGDAVSIGADAANDVSFADDDRLQRHHAVIRRVAARWLIEGGDGTLIQLGDAPAGRMHWLSAGDVIHLTPAGPEIIFVAALAPTSSHKGPPARRQLVDRPHGEEIIPLEVVEPRRPAAGSVTGLSRPTTPAEPSAPARGPHLPSVTDFAPTELADLISRTPAEESDDPADFVELTLAPGSQVAQQTPIPPAATPGGRQVEPSIPHIRALPMATPGGSPPAPQSVPHPGIPLSTRKRTNFWLLAGGAGVFSSVALITAIIWLPRTRPEATGRAARAVVTADSTDSAEADEDLEETTRPHQRLQPRKTIEPEPVEPVRPQPSTLTARQVEAAFAAVGVEQESPRERYRLGTAWVAGPKKLVTTASIVLALNDLESQGARPVLVFSDGRAVAVTRRSVHPRYQELANQVAEQRRMSASLTGQAALDSEQRLLELREKQAEVDIGLLSVGEETPIPLELRVDPQHNRRIDVRGKTDQQTAGPDRLTGFPFPVDEFRMPAGVAPPIAEAGKLTRLGNRLEFKVSAVRSTHNWAGSAVLNADHQVLGLCSGPSPDESTSGDRQSIIRIQRLFDFDVPAP